MKLKIKKGIIALILITTSLVFCINTNVHATDATENVEEEAITTSEETESTTEISIEDEEIEIYEGDLYVIFSEDNYSSTTYVMDKYVDGNVFIVGQNVRITGQVNGSLFVIASSVTIEENSYVACHTFAVANTISMSGITTDMYATCENFNLTEEGLIYRDLKLGTSNANLYGSVGRNFDLIADEISVYADDYNYLYIGEDFNYTSGKEIENIDKITVNGEISYTEEEDNTSSTSIIYTYIYDGITNCVFIIIIYALLIWLTPKFVEKSKDYVSTKGILACVIGFAFAILLPILAIIIFCTIIGIPVSLIALVIYFVILMISSAVVAISINEYISGKISGINTKLKKILMIIPVSIVIYAIEQIPVIGGIIEIIIFFAGIGITVLYQFNKRKKEKVVEE